MRLDESMAEQLSRITEERDALLAAAKSLVAQYAAESWDEASRVAVQKILLALKAAIALCEKKEEV